MSKIQLKPSSILNVPLQTYNDNFTFIVNGQEFKTNRLISDLLSTKISKIHSLDPTVDRYTINTHNQGDFSYILKLMNFNEHQYPTNQDEFIYEVIDELGFDNYEMFEPQSTVELTVDNVISYIKNDEKKKKIFKQKYLREVEFISSNFSDIASKHRKDIFTLQDSTIADIISNSGLQLQDEDELFQIVNELYKSDRKFSFLYQYVIFENVSSKNMIEFFDTFDYGDLDRAVWLNLSTRLQSSENKLSDERHRNRYKKKIHNASIKELMYDGKNEFKGIIKYLTDKTGGNIHDNGTIKVTTSSLSSDHPKNLLDLNSNNYYRSVKNDDKYVWICFDFQKYEIEISKYSIKSFNNNNSHNIKNWVIEISNDGQNWTTIDEHKNYTELKGSNVKTFEVSPNNFSRYCRLRHTGEYWGCSGSTLRITSIEFYGCIKEPQS